MLQLVNTLNAWGRPDFESVLKSEIQSIDRNALPLQQGLTQSSQVSNSKINVVVLNTDEDKNLITVKTGIFYSGIIAGSCCADDPTPVDELTEYCEILFKIDRNTAATEVTLL